MGTIELQLTQFKKVLFLVLPKKRNVGFMFVNKAMLVAAENAKIELNKFFEWADKNRTLYFAEMLYAAYVVWCQSKYNKPVFSKSELIYSFGLLSDAEREKVLKVWSQSETFGVRKNKKKAVKT